ncbi:MAG: ATP synthase F1 subunit gamma [Bacteroidetes bacterium]|nr:ATP synthase F1 subunit gamma [Bacteroidota bacterium]
MATLRDIRSRIKGVKNTQQITKAMKMVAAAKLRRAQDSMLAARPYSRKIKALLADLVTDERVQEHPLIKPRPEVINVALVVVTADRGLCGSFNSNLIKSAVRLIQTEFADYQASGNLSLITVGRVGSEYFKKRGYNVIYSNSGLFGHLSMREATAINTQLNDGFLAGRFDKIVIISNEFKNVMTPKVTTTQLLPVQQEDVLRDTSKYQADYIFEPDPAQIIEALVPLYLLQQIWQVLLESYASEQGARMSAMDAATENAKELLRSLTLNYNRVRQAAITKEILEIISGAESLSKSS